MSKEKTTPMILDIGGVRIGGDPQRNPTVLVGSIFYLGDKLVQNHNKGEFDKAATEKQLHAISDITEKTKQPTMLDVVATTPNAIATYLRYLADVTQWPLLIDGSASLEVNMAGIEIAEEAGLLDRVVLNSLTPDTDYELYNKIKECRLKNAVLLAFTTSSIASVSKRVKHAQMLFDKASHAGIKNALFDTGVVDLPTLGIACEAQHRIKSQLGMPVGCGAHNAFSTWKGFDSKFSREAKLPAYVGSVLMPVALGADFVLYGPVKHAPIVYPAVYMIDTAMSGLLLDQEL